MINKIFKEDVLIDKNFIILNSGSEYGNQQHTNDAFSEKWKEYEKTSEKEKLYDMQKKMPGLSTGQLNGTDLGKSAPLCARSGR